MAKRKKAPGRLIGRWKQEALAAHNGASDEELARVINDRAREEGYDYTITPEKVRAKSSPGPQTARQRTARTAPERQFFVDRRLPASTLRRMSEPRASCGGLPSALGVGLFLSGRGSLPRFHTSPARRRGRFRRSRKREGTPHDVGHLAVMRAARISTPGGRGLRRSWPRQTGSSLTPGGETGGIPRIAR
jgi:hypothetical protein